MTSDQVTKVVYNIDLCLAQVLIVKDFSSYKSALYATEVHMYLRIHQQVVFLYHKHLFT